MDHGGRRRHTAAMGPHPRQQSTQQSTNIICDGSTLLKLETKLFITSNITINARRVDVDERRRRCSNATMGAVQPGRWYRRFWRRGDAPNNIFDEGWRGGEGGRGLRTSNVVSTQEKMGTLGLWWQNDFFCLMACTSVKKYGDHNIVIMILIC
jgi:hypothetical protein